MAASAKPLFRATKRKRAPQPELAAFPEQGSPAPTRDGLDYDPTPPDATAAFLAVQADRLHAIGGPVWEPAVGGGHMADELSRHGFDVIGSDVVDRGWDGTVVRSLYDFEIAPADIIITNPPYGEINARDGHGRWLRHIRDLNVRYVAMLLNADWMAARINGMDALHDTYPVSIEYICCWKIDFRGGGSPPQRNAWLVWDRDWSDETVKRRLFRNPPDSRQSALNLDYSAEAAP
ncbi:hypothetical protein [Roseobacter sp. CCS2]|uniref:hypothetical protein n=1 Tax=Roseobacter sp. CCS2 TaxID=391593 RepID=UPI0000F3C43D|nr:hypothetical protein [Roseobacter sp. CCS2]EBA11771.1 hypothetical protein RCCS2_17621 [Roseobacter sp. CCS2]